MNRCTGHCCKDFYLPFAPIQLAHETKKLAIGKSRYEAKDFEKISKMLIFLRTNHNKRRARAVGGFEYRYTCKHFDRETGNCMNYENRPRMCSDYPYGGKCTYRGCTLQERCEAGIESIEVKIDVKERVDER